MDFTGSIINEYNRLPEHWWLWLAAAAVIVGLICMAGKLPSKGIISRALLFSYVLFILFVTIIGRSRGAMRAELVPFWSYSRPELKSEIILNYILFIPLGFFLYAAYGKRAGMKTVFVGLAFSCAIELSQLIFRIGLFEFDDIIGNTVGCPTLDSGSSSDTIPI